MEVAEVWDGLGLNLSSYQKERQDIYIRKLHFNNLASFVAAAMTRSDSYLLLTRSVE
jgi:hypothetical protein